VRTALSASPFFRYDADLSRFVADARKEMERVKQSYRAVFHGRY
jgi:hypothetical protein